MLIVVEEGAKESAGDFADLVLVDIFEALLGSSSRSLGSISVRLELPGAVITTVLVLFFRLLDLFVLVIDVLVGGHRALGSLSDVVDRLEGLW